MTLATQGCVRGARTRALLVAPLTAALVLTMLAVAPPAAAATDKLPDLGMAKLRSFRTETTAGKRLLRFTTIIVNVGAGRFRLRGTRPSTAEPEMSVKQRIYRTDGTHYDVSTAAKMFYSGDGHNHWHVRDLQTMLMLRLDDLTKVAPGAKQGFCFYDNYAYKLSLPGAPQSPVYTGCGSSSTLLGVTMGLSVGWGDKYSWYLAYQWIDITGVPSGNYRVEVSADNANWFLESNDGNNKTWADIQLTSTSVTVLAYGPTA